MPNFFAHADALVVSLKDIPIFALTVPYKTRCYMACGKPIIASLNGEGARLVEESGAGIAAPASQPAALADAIVAMMDAGAEQLAAYSANAYGCFEANYSPARVYDDLEYALKEAAGKKARA